MARIIIIALLAAFAGLRGAAAATSDPMVGTWMWGLHQVEVVADFTAAKDTGIKAKWKFLKESGKERAYQFSWDNSRVEDVTLSSDGQTAAVRSSIDEGFKATRLPDSVKSDSARNSPSTPEVGGETEVEKLQRERTAKYVRDLEALMKLLQEAKTPVFYQTVRAEHDAYASGGKTDGYPPGASAPGNARILRNGFEADLARIEKNGGAPRKAVAATADPFDIATSPEPNGKPTTNPAALPSNPKKDAAGNAGTWARYVRIELPRRGTLSLAEVQVFSAGKNVAPSGSAKQSSTAGGGEAWRAIDGNTDGRFGSGTITHTVEDQDHPWWELDLGHPIPIEAATVWNRSEDGGAYASRLEGFTLTLLDSNRHEVFRKSSIPAPRESVTIPLLVGLPGSNGSLHAAATAPLEAISSLLPNRELSPFSTLKSSDLTGRFYVNIDDDVWVFVNGEQIFHNSEAGRAQSPVTRLSVGDRVTARLLNRQGDRFFALAFASLDKSKIVSFRHTDFKILPDAGAKDFVASALGSIAGVAKEDRGRAKQTLSIFPFKHHSESVWGEFDECCLACIVTPTMITNGAAVPPGAAPPELEIIDAKYGVTGRMMDVTEQLRSRIMDNTLHLNRNWDFRPDPASMVFKDLIIHYKFGAQDKTATFTQPEAVTIP